MAIDPTDWLIVLPASGGGLSMANPTPAVAWYTPKHGRGMIGRLNTAGAALVDAIVAEQGGYESVGLTLRRGIGADEGKFAIQPEPHRRGANVKTLRPIHTKAYTFACTGMVPFLPPSGSSRLQQHGHVLVASAKGWEVDAKYRKRGPRARKSYKG